MDARVLGLPLIVIGAVLVLVGLGIRAGLLNWFGRLPGDLGFEGENVRIDVPIASMLVISVILTLALVVAARLR